MVPKPLKEMDIILLILLGEAHPSLANLCSFPTCLQEEPLRIYLLLTKAFTKKTTSPTQMAEKRNPSNLEHGGG